MGNRKSIPYLIKSMQLYSYTNFKDETQYLLKKLTNKDFGHEFTAWKSWWEDSNKNQNISKEFKWDTFL